MKAHPLNGNFKKGSPNNFELEDDQLASFRSLIYSVCSPLVLGLPVTNVPYSVRLFDVQCRDVIVVILDCFAVDDKKA